MNAPPLVAIVVGSETVRLRIRLMVEAEGARVRMATTCGEVMKEPVPDLLVVTEDTRDFGACCPGVPVEVVADCGDWDALRRRLSARLRGEDPVGEAERLAESLSRARILLVDDSLTYREFLRQELVRQGASVTACGNAEDAVIAIDALAWDAVLLDLIMPGVDGIQLCNRLARMRRERARRFLLVVLSSREGRDDLVRSFEAGADAFLGKSQDPILMRVRLGALLRYRFLHTAPSPNG